MEVSVRTGDRGYWLCPWSVYRSTVNVGALPVVQGAKHPFVCYNSGQQRDTYALTREGAAMTTINPEQVLDLARRLSPADQRWLALHLQEHLETTLPEHATLDEAVELYLADACSLGRAAELAGVTRWDVLDALQARDAMQRPGDVRSADEMDDLAERLEQQGIL